MRALRYLIACLLVSSNAWAIIPEAGWWWSPSESGRGFNLETQNNLLFFASFAYDSSGNAIWLTAGGPMTSDRDFAADLTSFRNGQCFGCPYRAPTPTPAGRMTLRFTSSQTAVLTINGTAINIRRFDFWENETAPDAMLGEFSYVIGSATEQPFDGERVGFLTVRSDSNGVYLSGNRLGSNSSAAIVGYLTSLPGWQLLLDSSATHYRLFRFNQTGFNRVEGNFWVYPKGTNPTGSGVFFQAFRTASVALITTGAGPGSSKTAASEEEIRARQESIDAAAFKAMAAKSPEGGGFDGQALADLRVMERRLEEEKRAAQGGN
jgi:hypothetical protein